MLFSINRYINTTPTLPSIGDFYASFVAEVTEFLQPSEERAKKKSIAKTQTWQQQKEIFLRYAAEAAAAHNAEQARAAKRKRVKKS